MDTYVDRKKLFVPGLAKLYESLAPLSYTLIRFSLGVFLIPHGYAKLFQDDAVAASRNFVNFGWSNPLAWAYFIGALEFIGGIMLAVGLLTRIVAAAFVIEMSVISFGWVTAKSTESSPPRSRIASGMSLWPSIRGTVVRMRSAWAR